MEQLDKHSLLRGNMLTQDYQIIEEQVLKNIAVFQSFDTCIYLI